MPGFPMRQSEKERIYSQVLKNKISWFGSH